MITYHPDLIQGSEEWLAARCGLLTASEMNRIITPSTLKFTDGDKSRTHLWELLAQRITRHVEPQYQNDDILRGHEDEIEARAIYSQHFAPVREVGFVTNTGFGFTLGCSPDGLVGDDGMIECKSRRQKYQIETIVQNLPEGTIPQDYTLQIQTALLVTGRQWCDFISYSAGLPMITIRVRPIAMVQQRILTAAQTFEQKLGEKMGEYWAALNGAPKAVPTERRAEQEILV